MKKVRTTVGVALVALLALAGTALADFSPGFSLELFNKKVKGNPSLAIHLEFDAEDEEIGNTSRRATRSPRTSRSPTMRSSARDR